ncbi:hypothetical protein PABG_01938 [Paracoccidioides brasiliensis Pb03]|nr:hypothetical protein PABG_01938 [Paracoccidioides brasiliensis Pb03]
MNPATLAANFIHAFRALPTPDARQQFFRALVPRLSHKECSFVIDLFHDRFHFDLVSRLPIELLAQVASYLPPWDVFVSKRWNDLWSSSSVCSSCFHACFPGQQLDTSNPEWPLLFRRAAKCRLALVTGRPYRRIIIPSTPNFPDELIAYHDGKIVTGLSPNQIQLLYIETGETMTFQTENRESISDVEISNSAIAAITKNGYCHVWNFQTGEKGSFRLPSAMRLHYTVDADTVAVWFADTQATLITWDLQSRQAKEIKLGSRPFYVFLDAKAKSIITFHCAAADGVPCDFLSDGTIHYSGMTVTQHLLQRTTPTAQQDKMTATVIFPDHLKLVSENPLVDKYGLPILTFQKMEENGDTSQECSKFYSSPMFSQPTSFDTQLAHMVRGAQLRFTSFDPSDALAVYSDLVYFFRWGRLATIVNFQEGTQHVPEIMDIERALHNGQEIRLRFYCYRTSSGRCIADERFLGARNKNGGIYFWCFDEDMPLSHEDPAYRRLRDERAAERAVERARIRKGQEDRRGRYLMTKE